MPCIGAKRVPVRLSRVTPNAGPNASPDETATGVRAIFAGYAATLGLDVERFKKDMDTEQVKARIKSDQERGASIGVDRTPILFIDGVQIPFSSLDEKELRGVIDAALSGKTPDAPASMDKARRLMASGPSRANARGRPA